MIEEIPGLKGLVARLLLENSSLGVREIREVAVERYSEVAAMTAREFGGRYVLPLKRQLSRTRRPRDGAPSAAPDADARGAPRPSPSSGSAVLDAAIRASRPVGREGPTVSSPEPPSSRSENGSPPLPHGASGPQDETFGRNGWEERRRIRSLFNELALELSGAATDRGLVEVIAKLDRYVDEAMGQGAPTAQPPRRSRRRAAR